MDSLKRGAAIGRPCQAAGNKEALFDAWPSISRAHLKAAHTHAQPPAQGKERGGACSLGDGCLLYLTGRYRKR